MAFNKHARFTAVVLASVAAGLGMRWVNNGSAASDVQSTGDTKSTIAHQSAIDPGQLGGSLGERLELIDSIEKASVQDLIALDAEFDTRLHDPETESQRWLLWMRWLELDPESLILHYRDDKQLDSYRFAQVFGAWARLDASAAMAGIDKLIDEDKQVAMRNGVLQGLAEFDTDLFLRYLDELATADVECSRVIEHLLARGRDGALAVAEKLSGSSRWEALNAIGEHWGAEDQEAALAWALGLDAKTDRSALVGVIRAWATTDPEAAGAYIKEIAGEHSTGDIVGNVASRLAATDPLAALDWANRHCSPSLFMNDALRKILPTVPVDQLEPFMEQLTGYGRGSMYSQMEALMSGRSTEDLAAIATLANGHADDSSWKRIRELALQSWAQNDIAAAVEYVGSIADKRSERQLYRELMPNDRDIDDDYDKALEIALALPGQHSERAFQDIASEMATEDLARAVALVETITDESIQKYAYGSIADSLAGEVPAAAAEWVATLPAGPNSQRAHYNIGRQWAGSEPYGASEWVAGLAQGIERDQAAAGLVKTIAYTDDVESAFLWAVSIEHPEARSNALAQVGWTWAEKKPELGLRTIAETDALTEVEKEKLTNRIMRALERED